ncbi:MAG: FtsW/RodA/SpoVE family cell cycle protein [Oscillospiraceae bacterium]|jgi:cell division protein FtsW (lipid II flippase)|nr:FtsW/RodA/SpoVE family cell cycle protein [Oscillospiraceae bacterium]
MILSYLFYISRYILPLAAAGIIFRCARSLLSGRYEPEVWGYMELPDGARVPLRNWECTVGASRGCDVRLQGLGAAQLVLLRDGEGNWTAHNISPNTDVFIEDEPIFEDGLPLRDGDTLEAGGQLLRFYNLSESERRVVTSRRTAPGRFVRAWDMFIYISLFLVILLFQHIMTAQEEFVAPITLAFTALFALMWSYYVLMRLFGRRGLEIEALAFFLSGLGLSVCASCSPESMRKQVLLIIAGLAAFLLLGAWLRDLKRVKSARLWAAVLAGVLLAVNIIFGTARNGSNNWIELGGVTIQPSEFVKILYIYAGAATMDRLYLKKNILLYVAFSAACVGALALMGDFGTALVFFAAFLVISFLRSGNFATIVLALTGAALAGFLAMNVKPYIAERIALWRHAWEDVYVAGFQQTRAMSAAASGGLFGTGAGGGWLNSIVASKTDMVFALISEELGLLVALTALAALIVMAVFVVRNAARARSSFFVIAGVGAVAMMLVQTCFNVFGSLDILPFTGVTFPFVSMGGSSLISCWAMLAFIKATDTRRSASFVVKQPGRIHDRNEFTAEESFEEN